MIPQALLAALLSAGVAGLVQQNVIKDLPAVEKVLAKPQSVLGALSAQIKNLQKRLAEMKERDQAETRWLTDEQHEKVTAQAEEIARAKKANRKLQEAISVQARVIAGARGHAEVAMKASRNMVDKAEVIKFNLTSAQHVIQEVLGRADDKLHKAPVLDILRDLAEKDAADTQKHRFDVITHSSLLQIGKAMAQESKVVEEANAMVQEMMGSFGLLAQEQNKTMAAMKAEFERAIQQGNDELAALAAKKVELMAELASGKDLSDRVDEAAKYAVNTRTLLAQQSQGFKDFAKRVANSPMPSSKVSRLKKNGGKKAVKRAGN